MTTVPPANTGKEAVFDLDAAAFASDHFRMHEFKVKRCPRARPHDWTQCPFAHPGEKARRRDPRRYRYSGTACPEFRKSGCCRRGDACPFAHGVFECWLHPSRYRTQLCTDGTACKRRVCFFAHSEAELRRPEDDPVVAQRQVQAELAAEVQTLQQQHLTQALLALLEANGQTCQTGPATSLAEPTTAELLKQTHEASKTPVMANGDLTASNTNLQLALAQQVALLQQIQQQQHKQQQQRLQEEHEAQQAEQAQQLLSGLNLGAVLAQPSDSTELQAVLDAARQNDLAQMLKNQLAKQLKTSNPALDAMKHLVAGVDAQSALPGDSQGPNVTCTAPIAVSIPLSAATWPTSSVAQTIDNATVLAGGSVAAGLPVDQHSPIQMCLLQKNCSDVMESLYPGQVAALKARAFMAGQRRSIDNGVLARSASDLAIAVGSNARSTALNGQSTVAGFPVSECSIGNVQSIPLDTQSMWSGLPNEEALKQAKVLLENLTLLQARKNGSSSDELLQEVDMESLLNANGLSAMNRATSFDK